MARAAIKNHNTDQLQPVSNPGYIVSNIYDATGYWVSVRGRGHCPFDIWLPPSYDLHIMCINLSSIQAL